MELENKVQDDFQSWGTVLKPDDFNDEIKNKLSEKGFSKVNSRLVFSVCPDDVNRLEEIDTIENRLTKEYDGEFHLGGLGAYPMGGVSGIIAASHHPPDDVSNGDRTDGNLIFFLSPHFGIIKKDDYMYGKIIRPGQEKITSSCGAMMGFLGALKEAGDPKNFNIAPDDNSIDPTRIVLHNDLINNYSAQLSELLAIEDSNQQVIDLFKLNSVVVKNKADAMIQEFIKREKDHFKGNIAIINGVTANLPGKDLFILKDLTFPA